MKYLALSLGLASLGVMALGFYEGAVVLMTGALMCAADWMCQECGEGED